VTAAPLLEARAVVAGYLPEIDILTGVDLDLHAGELVGVIGPNGAGKSTLLRAVFGLLPLRSGSVHLAGEDITNLAPHQRVARRVGFVPQTNNVFPRLSVEENLRIGLYQAPRELFPMIARRRKQRAGSLSGGERQLVGMARALMADPRILLLDEPSAGLSPIAQDAVFDRIQEINEAGVSIVMVEQNARRCLQISDRGYVLDQGRNAYTGAGPDLLADPKIVELYLGTLARA